MSIHSVDYAFTAPNPEPRGKDAFGLDTQGRIMLMAADRFAEFVDKISEVYTVSQGTE
jgi:protein BCP1